MIVRRLSVDRSMLEKRVIDVIDIFFNIYIYSMHKNIPYGTKYCRNEKNSNNNREQARVNTFGIDCSIVFY